MFPRIFSTLRFPTTVLAAFAVPPIRAQTTPVHNGVPATIVASSPAAVELVMFEALGGADNISLNDLSPTGLRHMGLIFGDPISIAGNSQPRSIAIKWAGLRVSASGDDPANDRLIIQTAADAPAGLISASDCE